MTAEELTAMRAALVAARSTGALRTTFRSGGTERTVEFKTDSQMADAIAAIDRELASLTGQRVRKFLPTFKDGFQ